MKTPFPWFRHGRILVGVKNGVPDIKRPVATFTMEDDATTVANFLDTRVQLLVTLRGNLKLLEDELTARRLSGLSEYIAPVEIAVDRTKQVIAIVEGWT